MTTFNLSELIKEIKIIRYFFLFRKVEKNVLGFKLHKWQKQLIVGVPCNAPKERKCGYTTAHILSNLLAIDGKEYRNTPYLDELPTDYFRLGLFQEDTEYLSVRNETQYRLWYYRELKKMAHLLMKNGVRVRRILYVTKYLNRDIKKSPLYVVSSKYE